MASCMMLTVQPTMCRREGKRVRRVGTTRSNSMAYDEEQNNMAKVGSGPAGQEAPYSSSVCKSVCCGGSQACQPGPLKVCFLVVCAVQSLQIMYACACIADMLVMLPHN